MNITNKFLIGLILILILILAGFIFVPKLTNSSPRYWAVYLTTGDLYFGQKISFPNFGLKNVYTISVNQQDAQNPLSLQRFANVFWGPEDYIKINREQVVWMTKLNSDGQLAQLLKNNPNLTPAQNPPGTQNSPLTPGESPNPEQ